MVRHPRFILFLASFLLLYFELVFIRWIPGHVRVIAYFTNFVLIACFFGMGLGMILGKSKRDMSPWVTAGILFLVGLAVAFKGFIIFGPGEVWLMSQYEGGKAAQAPLYAVLCIFYLALAAAFVPFGQTMGRCFGTEAPLLDYAVNLLGSVAGIMAFFIYSWFSFPAWAWYLLGMPFVALLTPGRPRAQLAALACTAGVTVLVWYMDRGTIWSPYHKIDIAPLSGINRETGLLYPELVGHEKMEYLPPEVGFNLRINDDFYQHPLNLSDAMVARYPELKIWRDEYDLPFRLKPNAERVLIVGGGTGNDAAAALRYGAKHVDMVDIDPDIVAIGKARHPEHPYDDPRVALHVDDARHFFHQAKPGSYDVVVFALLDSHRLLSTLSSLRLDSYVYTVESFQDSLRLLKPDGVQVTAFAVRQPWIFARFYEALRRADGGEPIVVHEQGVRTAGLVFVSGPGTRETRFLQETGFRVKPRTPDPEAVLLTDDWPYTYAQRRAIPGEYLVTLALILLLSVLTLRTVGSQTRLPDLHFFCLGAGFLLLETKNVTTLALVFGSTWYVNSIVFLTILCMALFSSVVTSLTDRVRLPWAYGGLFLSIALNYVLPLQQFAGSDFWTRLIVVGGITALPVFFSGFVFARSFKRTPDPAHALGSNVLGGVVGGVVEYVGMITGLRFLFYLIAGFYLLSLLALRPAARKNATSAPATVFAGNSHT